MMSEPTMADVLSPEAKARMNRTLLFNLLVLQGWPKEEARKKAKSLYRQTVKEGKGHDGRK